MQKCLNFKIRELVSFLLLIANQRFTFDFLQWICLFISIFEREGLCYWLKNLALVNLDSDFFWPDYKFECVLKHVRMVQGDILVDRGLYNLKKNVLKPTLYLLQLASKTSFTNWYAKFFASANFHQFALCFFFFFACRKVETFELWRLNFLIQMSPWLINFLLLKLSSHISKACVRQRKTSVGLP
jgi:hypothetical protein